MYPLILEMVNWLPSLCDQAKYFLGMVGQEAKKSVYFISDLLSIKPIASRFLEFSSYDSNSWTNAIITTGVLLFIFIALSCIHMYVGSWKCRCELLPHIPSPPKDHYIGHLEGLASEFGHAFKLNCAETMPIYQLAIVRNTAVFVNEPEDVSRVLRELNTKGPILRDSRYLISIPDIFTADYADYQKRYEAFGFQLEHLTIEDDFCDEFLLVLQKYSDIQEPFNASAYCTRLAMDIVFKTLFQYDLGALSGSEESAMFMSSLLILMEKDKDDRLFTSGETKPVSEEEIDSAKSYLDYILKKLLKFSKSSPHNTFAHSLVTWGKHLEFPSDTLKESDVDSLRDLFMISEIYQLIQHGYQTLAAQLQWILVALHTNPRARMEIERALAHSPVSSATDKYPVYVECFLKEVLRKYPAAGNYTVRTVDNVKGYNIKGYHIPFGTPIFLSIHSVHNCTKVWENAKDFLPERWISNSSLPNGIKLSQEPPACPFFSSKGRPGDSSVYSGVGHEQETLSFFPFSVGDRKCPCANFVLKIMRKFLTVIVVNFRLDSRGKKTRDIGVSSSAAIVPLKESSTMLYVTTMVGLGRPFKRPASALRPKKESEEEKVTNSMARDGSRTGTVNVTSTSDSSLGLWEDENDIMSTEEEKKENEDGDQREGD